MKQDKVETNALVKLVKLRRNGELYCSKCWIHK